MQIVGVAVVVVLVVVVAVVVVVVIVYDRLPDNTRRNKCSRSF